MRKSKIILLLSAMLLVASLFAIGCGKSIQVTFNGNGGTLVSGVEVQTVKNVDEIVLPVYEKEGYTLSWDKDVKEITEDTTVNAVWTANQYAVNFELNDSIDSPATIEGGKSQNYTYDAAMSLPTPVREGYTFSGWKNGSATGADFADGTVLKQAGGLTLYATWTVNTYTVTFNLNDTANAPATMEGEASKDYVYDAAMVLPTPSRLGYIFAGWRKGSSNGELLVNNATNKIAESYTAYATWTADDGQTFAITYDLAGGNMLESEENPTTYKASDATIILKNPVKAGFRFIGWTDGVSSTPVKNVVIISGSAGNKSYTANWEQIVYTINFVLEGVDKDGNPLEITINGEDDVADATVNAGESLGEKLPKECVQVNNSDYAFKGWKAVVGGQEIEINANTLFDPAIFGEADATINVIVKITSKWTGRH